MLTTVNKVGIERIYLNKTKAIYDKPTDNIILSTKKLKSFPLRSGTRQGYTISPYVFNIVQKIIMRTRKKNKR
jgi:hypothetical protein